MLIKEVWFCILQTIITALVIGIILGIFTRHSHAQDSGKYFGGSHDGFSVNLISTGGLNGIQFDSTRYRGGGFDGFAFSFLPLSGLNGRTTDLSKYFGGSYDGFTVNNISLTGLN